MNETLFVDEDAQLHLNEHVEVAELLIGAYVQSGDSAILAAERHAHGLTSDKVIVSEGTRQSPN